MRYLVFLFAISPTALYAQKHGMQRIDSLTGELAHTKEDTNRIKLLNTISYLYNEYSYEKGIKNGEDGLRLAEKLGWEKGKADAYNSLATNYNNAGNTDKAVQYITRALQINERTGNRLKMAQNLGNIGVMRYMQGNYAVALEYVYKALKIFEELKDKTGTANQLGAIGCIYHAQKNFMMALRYDTAALNSYKAMGQKPGQAMQLGNIANEYDALGEHEKALDQLLQAMKLYEELGNDEGVARNLNNIGVAYDNRHDYYNAMINQVKALQLYKKLKNQNGIAHTYGYIGQMYLRLATDSTKKEGEGAAGINLAAYGIAMPRTKTDKLREATRYLTTAVAMSKQINSLDFLQVFSQNLSDAQNMLGNYKEALASYKQYVLYKDSVFNNENNKKITGLEHARELDLKESKIKILEQGNRLKDLRAEKEMLAMRILIGGIVMVVIMAAGVIMYYVRRQRAEKMLANEKMNTLMKEQELRSVSNMLEVQEQERRRIASDLHDRLGSMLSTVKLYFNAVEEEVDTLEQQNRDQYLKATSLLDDACDEVRKISHDLVSGELVKFGLVSAISQLKDTIEDTGKLKINLFVFGMEARLDSAIEIALYRVIQELMNNILKHAKAGEVTIQLNNVENNLNIVVEDNGVGFDAEQAQAKDGMGMRNMETRVKKLKGTISLDSGKGRGTTTIIDIPVNIKS